MLSIVYITSRKDPKFEWFIESLWKQIRDKRTPFQVIFVDFWKQFDVEGDREAKLEELVNKRFQFIHTSPKPTPWQGEFKQTKVDWFAASNARNTGIAFASGTYITFVDDISVLMPGWVDQVIHAQQNNYVVAGAYKKVKNLTVLKGDVVSYDEYPPGVDTRWHLGSDKGIVPIESGGMYGCSFGAPTEALLNVNGLDEACDGQGGEDYDLSIRLVRAGYRLYYNRNMLTLESEELHHTGEIMKRVIKPGKIVAQPDGSKRQEQDASHVILNKVRAENRITPIGNNFILRDLREYVLKNKSFPTTKLPEARHWFDNQLLSEM